MIKIRKWALVILSIFLLFGFSQVVAQEQKISIIINNKVVDSTEDEQQTLIINNRTYVPLRVISENLGADVQWDKDSQQVLIRTTFVSYQAPVNTSQELQIIINGQVLDIPADLGQAFISSENRTMIPLRVVAEALDAQVQWLQNLVVINKKEEPKKVEVASNGERNELMDLTIMGDPIFTREQLKAFIEKEEARIQRAAQQAGRAFIPFPDVVDLYYDIGREYGVRGDIALFQALKETGYFQFTGIVRSHQNNYSGIWATGEPLTGEEPQNGTCSTKVFLLRNYHGATFASPAIGVEAQIQHLYAYATDKPLPGHKELYSPRLVWVQRGSAPTWLELTGRWAKDPNYGSSLIGDFVGRCLDQFNM